MAARIAGFRSRDDLGLRPPDRVSYNITPERGGCAFHWGGPAPRIRSHADCENTWRAWQRFHMDTRGWTDVAYTAAFCQHGYVLAGRGLGVRTAAQGTNDGNARFHAFVWIGGVGMVPTGAALDAFEWLVSNAREHGTGMRVIPHRVFTGSRCPDDPLIAHAALLDNKPVGDAPAPTEEDDVLERGDVGEEVRVMCRDINTVLHGEEDPRGAGKGHGLPVGPEFTEEVERYVAKLQADWGYRTAPGKANAAFLLRLDRAIR